MKNRIDAQRIAGRLSVRGDYETQLRIAAIINRMAARASPKGIAAEALANGLRISGRGLKRRMITDPASRSFYR